MHQFLAARTCTRVVRFIGFCIFPRYRACVCARAFFFLSRSYFLDEQKNRYCEFPQLEVKGKAELRTGPCESRKNFRRCGGSHENLHRSSTRRVVGWLGGGGEKRGVVREARAHSVKPGKARCRFQRAGRALLLLPDLS